MNYLEMARRALSAHEHAMQSVNDINDQNDISPPVPFSCELGHEPLEAVLKGRAIELWSDTLGERFWLVADDEDASLLGEPRGTVYTAAEARRVVEIADPAVVAEVYRWKRQFNATVRDFQRHSDGER
jgi:hypothetical protein